MAQDKTPQELKDEKARSPEGSAAAQPTAAAHTLQAAPAAVRRSMPMALSFCLGILLAALAGWLFYNLTWFLLLLYLSFVAATILEAPVYWLKRHGLRRGLAAVIVMVGGLIITAAILYFIGAGIYAQVTAVSANLERAPQRINDTVNGFRRHFMHKGPRTANKSPSPAPSQPPSRPVPAASSPSPPASRSATAPAASAPASAPAEQDFDVERSIGNALPGLGTIWQNTVKSVETVSWLVIMFFVVLYMLVDGADHLKAGRTLLPKHMRLGATRLFLEVSHAHRGWALASAANVCSASILTGTGLFLLGVPGALILGFFAGLGELIPTIGPIAGAVPALVLTLVANPQIFLYVAGMFVVVQTIQSYTISPQMLKFSIRMPVLVTLISVLAFGTLFGFLGILVAIPIVADSVVIWNYVEKWREKDVEDYDMINLPAEGRRGGISPDDAPVAKLRKLFRRGGARG